MVEVLNNKFCEVLPSILRDISDSVFIAIDTEFTGLVLSEKEKPSLFDDGEARYQKLKSSMSQFTICQMGLSCFSCDASGRKYIARTYNLPIRPHHFGTLDTTFTWQASSIAFLLQHNFDFNKVAYNGVPFLNGAQERQLRAQLSAGVTQSQDRNVDERAVQECCSLIADWLTIAQEGDRKQLNSYDFESVPTYVIVHEARERFPGLWASASGEREVELMLVSEGEKARLSKETAERETQAVVDEHLGFTRVFRHLVESKVPIVGHNCLTDLVLMYEKFHEPLPRTFSEFKQNILEMFPWIYDTKHICHSIRNVLRETEFFEKSGLGSLYLNLEQEKAKQYYIYFPGFAHAEGYDRYTSLHCPHEAGYDAYMAGCVFIRLAHYLQRSALANHVHGRLRTTSSHYPLTKTAST